MGRTAVATGGCGGIGPFGRVEEVGPAVLPLTSEEGSCLTGASINLSGGDHLI